MPGIAQNIAEILTMRRMAAGSLGGGESRRLASLDGFGSNPGNLAAKAYVPEDLPKRSPLVVVLHGCTQTAAGYDLGSGWSHMAQRDGFAVLFPEQQAQNNLNLCFNWFVPQDSKRDQGEPLSIRQMIAAMIERHDIDPDRVFITGLSAGGAMALTMLVTYPEVFRGGAIIAGLPHGSATSIPEAFERMRGQGMPDVHGMADLAREKGGHQGPWPVLSVWHGSADRTVSISNADAIVSQWQALQGIDDKPARVEKGAGHTRHVWVDGEGREVIESYTISGMGHGTPLDTTTEDGLGKAGPFMLEAGISSTARIGSFWGITAPVRHEAAAPDDGVTQPAKALVPAPAALPEVSSPAPKVLDPLGTVPRAPRGGVDIQGVIEGALRAAGLLR